MTSRKNSSRVLSLVTILWMLTAGFVTIGGNVGCDATQLSSLLNSFGITEDTIQGFVDSISETYGNESDTYGSYGVYGSYGDNGSGTQCWTY